MMPPMLHGALGAYAYPACGVKWPLASKKLGYRQSFRLSNRRRNANNNEAKL